MPKENTHLYFCDKIINNIQSSNLKELLKERLDYFYLGGVSPDSFYYSKEKSIKEISDYLHGKDGNLTNELVFLLLAEAKETKALNNLVFTLGYLSHLALDIIFHPVIYYFSGNYYDSNPEKRERAIYLHRHLETSLDKKLNNKFYFRNLIKINLLNSLSLLKIVKEKFSVSLGSLEAAWQRQDNINKLLRNNVFFNLVYFLNKISFLNNKRELAIFYNNLKKDKENFPDNFVYQDLISGEEIKDNLENLLKKAEARALAFIQAAYDYYEDKIDLIACQEIISGASLDTGKVGISVDQIKFTK